MQLPVSALFVAVLVGMSAQDLAFDHGLKPKARAVYYTTTRGSPFPFNNLTAIINEAGVPIGYDDFVLDTFEAAGLVAAVVGLVMGILHRNLNEATLFIWLAAIFYLRHATSKPQMDILIGNVKKPSSAAADEVLFWNMFNFFFLAATLYIQTKALYIASSGLEGELDFRRIMEERAKAWAKQVFDAADKDHDKSLSKTEIKNYFKTHEAECLTLLGKEFKWEQFFTAMDTDGDGAIDLEEFTQMSIRLIEGVMTAAEETKPVPMTNAEAVAWAARVFKKADTNRDKTLTHKEIKKYFKKNDVDRQTLLGENFHWNEFFDKMDTDGDGSFDLDEFTASCVDMFDSSATILTRAASVSTVEWQESDFFYTPALGLAIVLGVIVQGLLFDFVCTKGWVYQSRYYKEFMGGSWPWSDQFEALTDYPLPLMSWIIAVLAVTIVSAWYNFASRKGRFFQLVALGALGGVLWELKDMVIVLQHLVDIATEFKGKENKAIREEKNSESLVEIKDQNVMLLGLLVVAIAMQLFASYFTIKQTATETNVNKQKKTQ